MTKKKNLLIVSSRFPFPLEKGDKLRIYNQIKDLSKDFNLYLFSISETHISKADESELLTYLKDLHIHPISKLDRWIQLGLGIFSKKPLQVHYFYNRKGQKTLDSLVKEWKIDLIYCQLIRMSEYVNRYPQYKVLDYMDAFSLGLERRIKTAPLLQKPILQLEKNRVEAYQISQANKFNKLFIIAENDRKSIKTDKTIELLRNGVDFNYFKPSTISKKFDIVFVGNMQYHPNVLAAQFLVSKILPICKSKGLNLQILIAGANPTKEIKQLASNNVTISGWMDDIREAYWMSKIFVAPLFTGSGLQNKVLEAMASRIPVITTPIVNHSLGANTDTCISIADSEQAFARQIEILLKTMPLEEFTQRQDDAYHFVKEKYSWYENNKGLIQALSN